MRSLLLYGKSLVEIQSKTPNCTWIAQVNRTVTEHAKGGEGGAGSKSKNQRTNFPVKRGGGPGNSISRLGQWETQKRLCFSLSLVRGKRGGGSNLIWRGRKGKGGKCVHNRRRRRRRQTQATFLTGRSVIV